MKEQLDRLLTLESEGKLPYGGIRSVFPVPVDEQARVDEWWNTLNTPAPKPELSAAEARYCSSYSEPLERSWQSHEQARQTWRDNVARMRGRSLNERQALERLFAAHANLVSLTLLSPKPEGVGSWLDHRMAEVETLILHTLNQRTTALEEDWRRLRSIKAPDIEPPPEEDSPSQEIKSSESWKQDLGLLSREIRVVATRLRNLAHRSDTSTGLLGALVDNPVQWLEDLSAEALLLPLLVKDRLLGQSLISYQRAKDRGKLESQVTRWVLQITGVIVIVFGLFFLGRFLRQLVSNWQRRLFQIMSSQKALKGLKGLFWLLKPNIDWLTVLIGGQWISNLVPAEAYLMQTLSPATNTLALYLAARVIREWWGTRIFGRSNQFLTGRQSEDLIRSSKHFAWIIACFYLAFQALDAAGGGRLNSLLIAGLIVTLWSGGVIYCLRHQAAINAFLVRLLPASLEGGATRALGMLPTQMLYPLWLILGQIADIFVVIHQHLLEFDGYRRLATRLLKLRLESAAAEAEESDPQTQEVTRAYSFWFLERSSLDSGLIRQSELCEAVLPPIRRWRQQNSLDNVLLISGHQGAGKSTVLQIIGKHWEETPVVNLTPATKLHSRKDVEAFLQDIPDDQPTVIQIDRVEDFFLSDVGKLEGARVLLERVTAQNSNLYWVLSVHRPAWNYLSKVFRREYRILTHLSLPTWSATDIRKLILSRHHRSGFRLTYDELLLAASATSDAANFRAAESRVFNLLWEQSNGNPEQALHLWLEASQKRQTQTIEIGMPARPPVTALNDLSDDSCFVYSAIVRHRRLNSEEVGACTNLPIAIVRHALKVGLTLGLLETDEQERCEVNPLWYSTLMTLLSRKNMLVRD